jgi:hypothetical protein
MYKKMNDYQGLMKALVYNKSNSDIFSNFDYVVNFPKPVPKDDQILVKTD